MDYYGSIVHLFCVSGGGSFVYNGKPFSISKGDIAVVNQPQLAGDIHQSDDFACEYIVAPSKLLHGLLPANNFSIQGCVLLFDDSVSTYVNRAAVAIIKSYLDDNNLSITQIADEMQFTSVSYFSRYCVKHLGMSPARYRMAGAKG